MRTKWLAIGGVLLLAIFVFGAAGLAATYEALFTSSDSSVDRFDVPAGYIYNGGASSGGLDGTNDYGLADAPDYTGWNANHTGTGHYDDPSRGWTYGTANEYTDAYSSTEATDSGYVDFEWTFENVAADAQGYTLTVTADDLDDYVARKGAAWASVPDEWGVYVNGSYIGDLYAYDDTGNPGTDPARSINTFNVGNVSGSVKIEINGAYFDLLHDDAYYGISYGDFGSWGDTASAQHGIRLEGLKLTGRTINVPGDYSTIQGAVNAANNGDTINVAAGTYSESINVTKSLTLNGAKAGIDARTRSTSSGESILDGTGLDPATQHDAIFIANGVSNVIIDGFEIRNYAGGGLNGDGNAISSYCMSSSTSGASNVTVKNNYIHDLSYNGILVGSENTIGESMVVQSGWLIQYNKLASFGYAGIELTNVINSQVEDNVIAAPTSLFADPGDAGVGIEIAARSRAKPVTAGTDVVVSGNTITGAFPTDSRAAINLLSRTYSATSNATLSGITVSGNTISGAVNVRAAVLAVAESRSDGPAKRP